MTLLLVFCVGGLTVTQYRKMYNNDVTTVDISSGLMSDSSSSAVSGHRSLMSSGEDPTCHNSLESSEPVLAVFLYFIGVLYSFVGLAVVCDEYFVASLTIISDALNLSEDVAGATFMASASSAPELFTNVVDTFGESTNIGVGTIVGSAMFNILVIIAASGVFSLETLTIDFRPMVRDIAFYTVSIACMVGFFYDGEVTWWESLLLLLGYVLYVIFMVYNESILSRCDKSQASLDDDAAQEVKRVAADAVVADNKTEQELIEKNDAAEDKKAAPAADGEDASMVVIQLDADEEEAVVPVKKTGDGKRRGSIPKLSDMTTEVRTSFSKIVGLEDDDDAPAADAEPTTLLQKFVYCINPLTHVNLLLALTIPNRRGEPAGSVFV
jgi:Ca2+/Na+ antiporter